MYIYIYTIRHAFLKPICPSHWPVLPPQFQASPRSLTSPARATESQAAPGQPSPLLEPPRIAHLKDLGRWDIHSLSTFQCMYIYIYMYVYSMLLIFHKYG